MHPARASGGPSTATIPQDRQNAERLTLCYSLGIPHCVRLPIISLSVLAFPSLVTIPDRTITLPRPGQIGVWGRGDGVGLRSSQWHQFMLFYGARRAPAFLDDCVEEIPGADVSGLMKSVGRVGS